MAAAMTEQQEEEVVTGGCSVSLAPCEELDSNSFIFRCHPEDLIHWGLYSGDYARLEVGHTMVYGILNPPQLDTEEEEAGEDAQHEVSGAGFLGETIIEPRRNELLLAPLLHRQLGAPVKAMLQLQELEQAATVLISGATTDHSLEAACQFFGTVSATRDAGTVRQAADAEDIIVDDEALERWQCYVDASRCRLRPAWPGLVISYGSTAAATGGHRRVAGAAVAIATFVQELQPLTVVAVLGFLGQRLQAGIVGPQARVERATSHPCVATSAISGR